jgi:hypothetical protein
MKRLDESLPNLQTMHLPKEAPTETGMPLSGPGCAELKTTTPSGVELSRATDDEVVQSLTLVFGSRPKERTEYWIGERGYDYRLKGYELTAPASPDQMARARAIVEAACSPMNDVELPRELTCLRAASVSSVHGLDLEAWMEVMIEELRNFPGAVVLKACKQWRRREKFLPACAELVEECHQLNRHRRALRRLVEA